MGLGVTTQVHVDIQKSNDKNKEGVGAIQIFIEVMIDVNEIT